LFILLKQSLFSFYFGKINQQSNFPLLQKMQK
jgi:hypothetical protein